MMPFASARKKSSKNGGNPYNDDLLNDWGIHHLHLGTEYNKRGKIKRSKNLLFCIINSKSVYFINIQEHKANWANKELLEIVYDNWSELLDYCNIDKFGQITLISKPNSDKIRKLRKKQYQFICNA